MALDEAIADTVRNDKAPPTLRLYGWDRPAVTLGAFQNADEVDLAFCDAEGIQVVRRPTGGRAILHVVEELTYSFSAPTTDGPFSGTLLESYDKLSQAFSLSFTSLGLNVRTVSRKPRGRSGSPLCFESPSYGEMTVDGRKVIGSAQRRRPGGLLQQGSIPLVLEYGLMGQVFGYTGGRTAMAGLRDFLPHLEAQELTGAVARAFCETFEVELIPAEVSEEEADEARRLLEEKYALESWTRRR
jgi:lipoate-protein ligase A